ncbi:hypothetical protein GCM10010510_10080 [Streptomyces anandii JCM 4720]|nr:hypothetical protein GCM10010510_10080 [Streptomyces anandii JCM 4720]
MAGSGPAPDRGRQPGLTGLDRCGDTRPYASRGADARGPPTRVGGPSGITVIRLACGQARAASKRAAAKGRWGASREEGAQVREQAENRL